MPDTTYVYILEPILNDPRFDGCVFAEEARSVLGHDNPSRDFDMKDHELLSWKPMLLSTNWKPQPVKGPANAFNDYPCLELSNPTFSKRAVQALGTMLSGNGELLPLKTKTGEYFVFNCTTKLAALNSKESILSRTADDRTALWVKYFSFIKSKLEGATIFRVPELPNFYLVTDRFKHAVESANLNGFNFVPVWPLPRGVDWHVEESKRRKVKGRVKISGQALILRFRLAKQKPSIAEKKLALSISESLLAVLSLATLTEKYWGTVEVCEFAEGEFRIFCSCPDSEGLYGHLSQWLSEVHWENDFDVVKRFGNLFDRKAKETRISVKSLSS